MSLIHSVTAWVFPFLKIFKYSNSRTVRARKLKLLDNFHHPLCVTCHMSHVACHVWHGTWKMSHVICLNIYILEKHRKNCKTLAWEHHIGCQMCRIALSKSTEKVNFFLLFFYSSDRSENNQATSSQKNLATSIFFTFSILLERAIWHTWQSMWCSWGSVLRFSQCFLERLQNFLTHLQGCLIFFVERCPDLFCRGRMIFCVER